MDGVLLTVWVMCGEAAAVELLDNAAQEGCTATNAPVPQVVSLNGVPISEGIFRLALI